jgi:hypothetical protein
VAERRSSSTRAAHEAEIYDILSIFDVLDTQGALVNGKIVASNLDNLSKYGPERDEPLIYRREAATHRSNVKDMSAAVEQIAASRPSSTSRHVTDTTSRLVAELQQKLEAFISSVCVRLDYLNNVCSQLSTRRGQPAAKNPLGIHKTLTAN